MEDAAGVAYILAKYQQRQGHESKVIKYIDLDKYGIAKFYQDYAFSVRVEEFAKTCAREAEAVDVVHIHSAIAVLFMLRKKFGRSKKLILHYHGTDIRGLSRFKGWRVRPLSSQRLSNLADVVINPRSVVSRIVGFALSTKQVHFLVQKLADAVLVSTPDLLQLVSKAVYLPNPVDIDHFTPISTAKNEQKEALTMDTEAIDIRQALHHCKEHNVDLDIEVYDRAKSPIMYSHMPAFLRRYKIYVDIRFVNQKILENLSKTALESLACGLTVLDYQLKFRQRLPTEHEPMNVVSQLLTIYSK